MNFRPIAAAALALAAAALAVGLAPVATASASPPGDRAEHGAVFVETNDETSNAIIAYSRGRDGHLTETARFPTGGLGGAVAGPVFDPLASQGALTYDADHQLLYAVNAGSDTLTSSPSTAPTSVSGRSSPAADTCRSPWASHVTWCTS